MTAVVYKVGDTIANRYRVKDIVGSGGAGVVYRARDERTVSDVAIKVINAKLVQTPEDQRLFARHIKIAHKLDHPNVVRIYDEGRDEGRPFFTMQFLEGLSLRKIIDLRKDKGQVFSLAEIEPIFHQLAQALDFAHRTTLHGDLKPDNVIVLPDLLKVTDFALLRGLPRKPFLAIQKQRGTSFRYLAPEVRNEVVDLGPTVDVYSLGVVLGEMLTGVVHDDARPELFRRAAEQLSVSLARTLLRAVARSPNERPASAGAMVRELVAATAGPQTVLDPGGPTEDPTQRLDIRKHGIPPREESTGSFSVDEEMIENAAPARREAPRTVLREEGRPIEIAGNEEATEASLDVMDAMEAFGALEEISASSLELLEEPGLVIVPPEEKARIDAGPPASEPEPPVPPAAVARGVPLPAESNPRPEAIPSSLAFSEETADATTLGRLVGDPVPAVAPATVVDNEAVRSSETNGAAGRPRTRPSTVARSVVVPDRTGFVQSPTGVLPKEGKKERPMTRPRVSAIGAMSAPLPAVVEVPQSSKDAPAADDARARRRWMALTAIVSLFALILLGLVVWIIRDNAQMIARQNEVIEEQRAFLMAAQKRAEEARVAAEKAESEARVADEEANKAEAAAAKAEAAKVSETKAARAAEAARRAAEAEAKRAADAAARRAAVARAEEARAEVEKRRARERAAAQRAEEARATAARERRAREEAARRAAAARAEQERAERERQAAESRAREDAKRKQVEAARAERLAAAEKARREAAEQARAAAAEEARRPVVTPARPPITPSDEPAARVEPPPPEELECPRGMTLVKGGAFMIGARRNDPERNFGDRDFRSVDVPSFCVDYYEYPNGRGRSPTGGVTWNSASSRCKRRGKRLCTEEEWEKACKGPGGTRYPYGNAWDPSRCNTEDEEGSDRESAGSGTFRNCRSGYNVFDMGGNVAEWTSSKSGSGYVVKGGSFDRPGYDSRCAARKTRSGSSKRVNLGFRCCAEPQ